MTESIWRSRIEESTSGRDLDLPEYPNLVRKFLLSRGLEDKNEIEKFLSPKLSELKDPFTMLGMDKAVERLLAAFSKQEKICIYADFDLDGTSGLALLHQGLKDLGFENLQFYQPKRLSEGYGFHAKTVEDLHAQNVNVIITVDVGITALEACNKSRELGLDVILTDHHLPGPELPCAYALINPNQGTCPSKLTYLSGAGVAFYLLRALKRKLVEAGLTDEKSFDLKSVLDCFTIATLTDMVPLVEDNRVLVKHGLLQLEKTNRPGLKSLLSSLGFDGVKLTSQDVAIRFAPKLNALSRLEMGILPIDIYMEEDATRADGLVKTVLKNNTDRVNLQSFGESEAVELLKEWPHKDFVVLVSDKFHRGVVGLIATKISQMNNTPAFVGSLSAEGVVVGSARLPKDNGDSLVEALESAKDVLHRFGGHAAAAGFEFHSKDQQALVSALNTYYETKDSKPQKKEVIFDIEAQIHEITENLMKWFDVLGPFGQAFQAPLFCFKSVDLKSINELKGGHLKLKLQGEQERVIEALMFSPSPRLKDMLQRKPKKMDVLGEVQWNYFNGKKSIQLLVKDLKEVRFL